VVPDGELGQGLATFLGHPAFRAVPAILETWPKDGLSTMDIDRLRDLRRRGVRRWRGKTQTRRV
jgi:DNA replication protein DnaD